MKTKTKRLFKTYYIILAAIVVLQTIYGCVRLSQTVSYQHQLSNLQKRKNELQKEHQQNQLALNQLNSLTNNHINTQKLADQSSSQQLTPISSPVVLASQQSLALK